jgi:tetratricopeptide (TPR) repeat protein
MSALTDIEENKLLEIMDRLIKTGFVKHTVIRGGDICSFADIIMRDVVHEEVGPFKRKKLHGVVGEALEKVYAEKVDEHLGELALHFLESGDKEKALGYFLKAGEKAAKVYANAEAASYLRSALKLLEEKEGEFQEKARVLEKLGEIKRIVGEYDLCLKHWNEALLLWKQLDEKEKVGELHRKMAAILWQDVGKAEQAREHFDDALRILETEPESVELAGLYAARSRMSFFAEDVAKARSWAEKGLELAKKLNAFEAMAISYDTLGGVLGATGEIKESVECHEKALKVSLDNGYVGIALRVYNNLANDLPAEENERRLDCYEKGLELAKKAGIIENIAWFEGMLAGMYFGMGNMDKTVTLADEYDALSRKIGNLFNLSNSTLLLGATYHVLGDWDKGEQYLEESLSTSQKTNLTQSISNSYGYLGWSYYDRGEYAKAKGYFDRQSEIYEKAGQKAWQMNYSHWIAMNYVELGEINKARGLLDEMHKFAHEKQDKLLIANEDAARAFLLRVEKKWNESVELFEKGVQEYEALHARQWNVYVLAKIFYEYARVYLERDQPADREKADKLLNQALEIFQKIGARKDVERVEAKFAFIETGREVPKPEPLAHVSTGYADLDKLLYGGIPSNCAVALTSPACNERDELIKDFLETGAKKGEVTFYITIDASGARALAEKSMSNFQLFVCNPEAEAIIKSSPNVFTLKGVENLTDISIALTSAIRQLDHTLKGPRRICIGLVSDVLLQHHAVETRRWLTALITKLKSEDFTTLAVIDPKMHPSEELYAILGLFEGEINIYEKGAEQFLKVKRMSNQEYLGDELLLKKEDLSLKSDKKA